VARSDTAGFFWDDTPPPKPPPKTKPKRNPPERTWERPDYLPNLAEALAFNVAKLTDQELIAATNARERFVFDIECYPNYFLVVFQSLVSGKIIYFEMDDDLAALDIPKLRWVMNALTLVSFNGNSYDLPIAALALAGKTCSQLWAATEAIITMGARPQDLLRSAKIKRLKCDHIDLIEVAPLRASLKIYAGRLHCERMQDLPFRPGIILSENQIAIVRWYCVNDTKNTALLYHELEEQIKLRERLSMDYSVDLRSKSDAQISETIIATEITKLNGMRPQAPKLTEERSSFRYNIPAFINYSTAELKWVLETIRNADFFINEGGEVEMPPVLKGLTIPLGDGRYRMGIGGLHSSEECVTHFADSENLLMDIDMTSFYPNITLNQNLFPQHLGPNYIRVYRQLVNQRVEAKRRGDSVVADSLKIAVNGGFGKTGSPYSILYSPHLLIQVTVTGQLVILMLIERLLAGGFIVVSANTDGIVIKCPQARYTALQAIIKQWEGETSFNTEETRYRAFLARDVNNYIAIKPDGKVKVKGAYSERGSAGNSRLSKNPTNLICADAAIAMLTTGKPISNTIRECRDFARFLSVRTVKGGAVKDGEYLGKSIRWYYATGIEGEIIYALNGNKVPRSERAKPCMTLPDAFPQDIDFEWYEEEAHKILIEIGYEKPPEKPAKPTA